MLKFDLYFSKRWSLLLPDTCLTKHRLSEQYFSNRSQDFLHRVSPGLFFIFEKPTHPSLARRNRIVVQFSQQPPHFCRRFLFFLGRVAFGFCLVVHQPHDAETNICHRLYSPFPFCKIGTQADPNIHIAIACKYTSNDICTVVEEWTHGYFCLGYFSSSTHVDLVGRMARMAWRQCARSLLSGRKLHWSPCEHWPFSFHW